MKFVEPQFLLRENSGQ